MQGMYVEAGDAFVALDGEQEVGVLRTLDVLDAKIVADASRSIP